VGAGGPWGEFSFTDVDGTEYEMCRFGMDTFQLRYVANGQYAVSGVVIEELV
jgi:hypothetical protein